MNKTRVAAYCRVSTASDMQDGSYETQTDYYREYIQSNPEYELVGVYGDHGISGREMNKRPGLQKLLQACRDRKIDLILVKSVSRFARNMAECVIMVRELRKLGVTLVFEKEGFRTDNLQCELMLNIMATIAEQESISISQNIIWSRQCRNERGEPMERQSYGYDKAPPDHKWVPNPHQSNVVRTAFYLVLNGANFHEVLDRMNMMEMAAGSDRIWKYYPLRYMLTNVSYVGSIITNKTYLLESPQGRQRKKNSGDKDQLLIEDHHEPLVSQIVFDLVQEILRRGLWSASRKRNCSEEERDFLTQAAAIEDEGFIRWKERNNVC